MKKEYIRPSIVVSELGVEYCVMGNMSWHNSYTEKPQLSKPIYFDTWEEDSVDEDVKIRPSSLWDD